MTDKIKPIQLISFESGRHLKVMPQSINFLKSINEKCRNLAIITVVGKYRTGKSYILNRVLLEQNSGFEVGPTINACTKGLWIWPQPIKVNDTEEPIYAIVMDTEGLGSLEEGENSDTKVFLMALLLSSYFIYNSVGSIDENAIQSLSLIVNLSKLLQKGNSKDVQDILNCFPSFLWLVRDFTLKLQDEKGKPIKPNEYLENALRLQVGKSEMAERKNSVRRELTNFFKERDCFMLIRPTQLENQLQKLSTIRDELLRPQFLKLVRQLRIKIFGQVKRKMFKGKPCSPSMFIDMCQFFCDAINRGDLPEISSNWDLVCKSEAHRIISHCQTDFQKLMVQFEKMPSNEVSLQEFEKKGETKMKELLKYMEKNAMGDKQKFKKDLQKKFRTRFEEIKEVLEKDKKREVESQFFVLNDTLLEMISTNKVKNIFELSEQYDKMIEAASKNSNKQTLGAVYKKAYEGFKTMAINFFSFLHQSQKTQQNILTEKVNLYQKSYTTLQSEYSSTKNQAEDRERELKNKIYTLQFKSKEIREELQRTKEMLDTCSK